MGNTGLLLDTFFCNHDPGSHHPEAPGRIRAINAELRSSGLVEKCAAIPHREATDEEVLLCHSSDYLQKVVKEIDGKSGGVLSTGDTHFSEDSLQVARRGAGGLLAAVDGVLGEKYESAFCAVRPPGHHATPNRGMGFCIFNNAAIAARYAQKVHGLERVAIIDWDVHHGNGTQDIFYEDGSVYYFSTHQHPWYPGTGARTETGESKGAGTTLNVPLPAGSGMAEIESAFRQEFTTAMKDFRPDLVIISAGFDSRAGDPLGNFQLSDADFVGLTKILQELAGEYSEGRLVSVLEGGYNQSGLASAVASHLGALIGETE